MATTTATPDIDLLFLGTGTSAGVPMIGCDCATCTSQDPRDRRTRCSVVIGYATEGVSDRSSEPERAASPVASTPPPGTAGKWHRDPARTHVLIDTAPELRLQAIANDVRQVDALVFTHAHADHVMGLDDVRRFNSIRGGPLDVWADDRTHRVLECLFTYAFSEPDPESALYRPHLVPRCIDGPFEIGGRRWMPVPLVHGEGEVLGFRVGDLAYCTDASGIPARSMDLLRGLDVLVLDALQHRKHPTHLTVAEALDVVAELRPRQTYLTHMSHGVLHARDEPKLPEGVFFAYDGLRVSGRG